MGETGNADKILTLKPLDKCLFERWRRWEGNLKMDTGEIGCKDEVQWQAWVLSMLDLWVLLPVFVWCRNCLVQHKQTTTRYKILNTNPYYISQLLTHLKFKGLTWLRHSASTCASFVCASSSSSSRIRSCALVRWGSVVLLVGITWSPFSVMFPSPSSVWQWSQPNTWLYEIKNIISEVYRSQYFAYFRNHGWN